MVVENAMESFKLPGKLERYGSQIYANGSQIYAYSWAYESEPDTPLIVGRIPAPAVHLLLAGVVWGAAMRRTRSRAGFGMG
jgi:hypothetical protein